MQHPRSLFAAALLIGVASGIAGCQEQQLIFPPVTDAPTRGYCGTCHMAYQPSMLPAASWDRMMNQLDDHFDKQVTLKDAASDHVRNYLVANAGDSKNAGIAGQTALEGLGKNARLLRITNTPYFKRKHLSLENRIPDAWVGSLANCTACHVGAWVGDYKK